MVKVSLLVVIWVTRDNQRMFLTIQQGEKDAASTWREIFKDLKERFRNGAAIELGIIDGLPGLEKVFQEEFPNANVQHCQVHVARDVLCKVLRKMEKPVADRIRNIFYAPRRTRAWEQYERFIKNF